VAASFATNADDEQDAQAGKVPPGGNKKDAGRQKIIVVASVVGVLIAYLTLRKSSSAPVGSTAAVPVPASSGVVASGGGGGGQQSASLDTYLQNLTQQITASNTALQSALAPTTGSALPPPFVGGFDPTNTNVVAGDTGGIYQIQGGVGGGLYHLSGPEYGVLGSPKPVSTFAGGAGLADPANGSRYIPFNPPKQVPATTGPIRA
jgi:hypothetical protein